MGTFNSQPGNKYLILLSSRDKADIHIKDYHEDATDELKHGTYKYFKDIEKENLL